MLETIDINSDESEVKLLNWSVELEARTVLGREGRRQLHRVYTYLLRKFLVVCIVVARYLSKQFVTIIGLATNDFPQSNRERMKNFIFRWIDFRCNYKILVREIRKQVSPSSVKCSRRPFARHFQRNLMEWSAGAGFIVCTDVSCREALKFVCGRHKRFSVDIEIYIYIHKYKLRSIEFSGGPAKKRIPFRGRAIRPSFSLRPRTLLRFPATVVEYILTSQVKKLPSQFMEIIFSPIAVSEPAFYGKHFQVCWIFSLSIEKNMIE